MKLVDRVSAIELEARERRTVALGALAAVVIVLAWLFTGGAPGSDARRDAERDRLALLARYRGLARQEAELERRALGARRVLASLRPRLLSAPDPTVAAAGLSGSLRRTAEASGLSVERTAPAALDTLGAELVRISVEVDFAGDVVGLRDFLGSLESRSELLTVPRMQLSVPGGATGIRSSRSPPLRIRMTVAGYFAPEESEPAGGSPAIRAPSVDGVVEGRPSGPSAAPPSDVGDPAAAGVPDLERIRRVRQSRRVPRRPRGDGGRP